MTITNTCRTQRIPLSAMLLFAAILVGCGSNSSAPSESDGQKVVEEMIAENSDGCLKFVKFTKTNGLAHENLYRMEFTADAEFLQDCHYVEMYENFYCETPQKAKEFMRSVNRRKGQIQSVSSRIDFEKTEKGWRAR